MKINVLGISGSPRIPSNSEYLLKESLRGAKEVSNIVETEVYSSAGKRYGHCLSCIKCFKTGECVQKDDFQELCEKWMKADIVIYSVPVYHMCIPGQLRCFIDRLGMVVGSLHGGPAKDCKIIGAIAQGAHIFSGQEHTITQIINHALSMGCIPVTGDHWEAYIGVGGWTSLGGEGDSIKNQNKEGNLDATITVRASKCLGRRSVELALMVKAGALANEEILKQQGNTYKPLLDRI